MLSISSASASGGQASSTSSVASAATSIILILLILHFDHVSGKRILLLDAMHDDGYDRAYQESAAPSLMQRLLINTRIDPLLFVPFINWRMSRMNLILELVQRCLHSRFCQRMIQHADLVTYERNWKRRTRITDRIKMLHQRQHKQN